MWDSLFSVRATGAVFVDRIYADGVKIWMKDDDVGVLDIYPSEGSTNEKRPF